MNDYKPEDPCPICGRGRLEMKIVDEEFEYKGSKVVVPEYEILECSVCSQAVIPEVSAQRAEVAVCGLISLVDGPYKS